MTRVEQLADAYEAIAKVNHYMVGIVAPVTDEEVDKAEQLLITRQNDTPERSRKYRVLNLALDLIQAEQRRRLEAASNTLDTTGRTE